MHCTVYNYMQEHYQRGLEPQDKGFFVKQIVLKKYLHMNCRMLYVNQ